MPSEKIKVVFLDRDGVINRERGEFTWKLEDFSLNDGLIESLKQLQLKGFRFIVITNQSGIARGIYNFQDVEFLHHHLRRILLDKGISLLSIYYCPHHPSVSKCICRKPDSLLIEKAIARFGVDATGSWFIGDAERDVKAAEKAGLRSVLIEPNSSLLKIIPEIC